VVPRLVSFLGAVAVESNGDLVVRLRVARPCRWRQSAATEGGGCPGPSTSRPRRGAGHADGRGRKRQPCTPPADRERGHHVLRSCARQQPHIASNRRHQPLPAREITSRLQQPISLLRLRSATTAFESILRDSLVELEVLAELQDGHVAAQPNPRAHGSDADPVHAVCAQQLRRPWTRAPLLRVMAPPGSALRTSCPDHWTTTRRSCRAPRSRLRSPRQQPARGCA